MKRAAAIIGPIPSFVRWAIVYQCPYRTPVDEDIPHQVFRQVRTLRETSLCRVDGRVIDGVCIHDQHNQNADTARGYPIAEVGEIFGDLDIVHDTCGHCPANVCQTTHADSLWAGCYGWFFSKIDGVNLVAECESAFRTNPEPYQQLGEAESAWFRIWQTSKWSTPGIGELLNVVQHLTTEKVSGHLDFLNFKRAVENCQKHGLELTTELVPAGHSDGVHWKIEPHCSICRKELNQEQRRCDQCGNHSGPVAPRKRKVLGLRPYMLLKGIYGLTKTKELLTEYRKSNA